jgi:hypothetical protein
MFAKTDNCPEIITIIVCKYKEDHKIKFVPGMLYYSLVLGISIIQGLSQLGPWRKRAPADDNKLLKNRNKEFTTAFITELYKTFNSTNPRRASRGEMLFQPNKASC